MLLLRGFCPHLAPPGPAVPARDESGAFYELRSVSGRERGRRVPFGLTPKERWCSRDLKRKLRGLGHLQLHVGLWEATVTQRRSPFHGQTTTQREESAGPSR